MIFNSNSYNFFTGIINSFLGKSFLMKLSEKYFGYFPFSLSFWPKRLENDKFTICKINGLKWKILDKSLIFWNKGQNGLVLIIAEDMDDVCLGFDLLWSILFLLLLQFSSAFQFHKKLREISSGFKHSPFYLPSVVLKIDMILMELFPMGFQMIRRKLFVTETVYFFIELSSFVGFSMLDFHVTGFVRFSYYRFALVTLYERIIFCHFPNSIFEE